MRIICVKLDVKDLRDVKDLKDPFFKKQKPHNLKAKCPQNLITLSYDPFFLSP